MKGKAFAGEVHNLAAYDSEYSNPDIAAAR